MNIKASTLVEVNNALYRKIAVYNNVHVPTATQLFNDYAVNPATPNAAAIPVPQRGLLFSRMAEFLTLVGSESAMRESECLLAQAGYLSIAEAKADAANHFSGSTLNSIVTSLTVLENVMALIDSIVSNNILNQLLTDVYSVKTGIENAAAMLVEV